ncbi:MAG TPA: C4-dicarboxylate ABC transporter [Solirubrobacteraceae bacterium]|nr:C4-dicarboxylate ABC transporter [Solirubrobacteraceae bacterium]
MTSIVWRLRPGWFAAVMGTGIVANAAALLPVHARALDLLATGVWAVAAALLALLLAVAAAQLVAHPRSLALHVDDPVAAPFAGAPPMALLTVAAGALLAGHRVIGHDAAVALAAVLWTAGTLTGLAVAALVPYLMFTRHDLRPEMTLATWLMPVAPPMVSAATGAALLSHVPEGQARLTLLVLCLAMLGASLVASLVTITLVWARMAYHPPAPAATVPTIWIVLGPLGQAVTAIGLLAGAAPGAVGAPYADALRAAPLLLGAPIWGFAMLWLAVAVAVTVRAARRHLPFSLSWWSFTFPVGTCVTGTSELALRTGADALTWIAAALFAVLMCGWLLVAARSVRAALPALRPPLAMMEA